MAKSGGKTSNFMVTVLCGGEMVYANSTSKDGEFCCTKCGNNHAKTKSNQALVMDEPASSKKKKFKKGKKNKK